MQTSSHSRQAAPQVTSGSAGNSQEKQCIYIPPHQAKADLPRTRISRHLARSESRALLLREVISGFTGMTNTPIKPPAHFSPRSQEPDDLKLWFGNKKLVVILSMCIFKEHS